MGHRLLRPESLVLTCADANDVAEDLVWSAWGRTDAMATGVDTWNACVPYCAASKTWTSSPADFTLSHPADTAKGWLFERLTVKLTGHPLTKVQEPITFSEAPVPPA
jgi:hypothetical protein